jgi:acyl carrier protein
LGLDQDLEAELGIDSIKRVEILGALQKVLPATLADQLNQQMESLTRVKSLNGVVDKLLAAPAVQEGSPLGKL